MRRLLFLAFVQFSFGSLLAQSVAEADQHMYYGRYNSAENAYRQITQQEPGNGAAWLGLARAYQMQGTDEVAANAVRNAPAAVANDPFYQVSFGTVLLAEQKNDSASIFFKKALEQTREKNPDVLAAVARAHVEAKQGDAKWALELIEKAIKRDKRNAHLNVLKGDAYRKLGNGGEAYKAYHEAISKNNANAEAYHKLGDIFLSQKNAELYLEHFNKAVNADPKYAPSLYKLYAYEFYHDPAKAKQLYNAYVANADKSIRNEYDLADLLYINKEYNEAIQKANSILEAEQGKAQPRLYKLVGYSYAGIKDTAKAINYMQQYFDKEVDSNIIAKDYESMAEFYTAANGNDSLAELNYAKAVALVADSAARYAFYKKLADMATSRKDYAAQGKWLELYYLGNDKANNLDLFNAALAYFRSENFVKADSLFGMYVSKYPDQSFGYYWQAKSKALLDSDMKNGLAIPAYEKLIAVLETKKDDANYQKWMVEAYGYLAAYEANTEKDYAQAVGYFQKVLEVDPENSDAKKYIGILEKSTAGSSANN